MKSVTFDNGRGFALGFDEAAPSPFVTWQFTETENGQKDYYWGHYHSSGQTAEKDFAKRVADYKEQVRQDFSIRKTSDNYSCRRWGQAISTATICNGPQEISWQLIRSDLPHNPAGTLTEKTVVL